MLTVMVSARASKPALGVSEAGVSFDSRTEDVE
jgi:hypothetical protein